MPCTAIVVWSPVDPVLAAAIRHELRQIVEHLDLEQLLLDMARGHFNNQRNYEKYGDLFFPLRGNGEA